MKRTPVVNNQVTRRLKEFITDYMNGKETKTVIQKTLFASDLKENLNRLNLPINQLETLDFLTETEKRDLENGKELQVPLLGPRLRMYKKPMALKIWHLRTTKNYVLITNWNNFVKENKEDLKENTMIQVWSFRRDHQLCFAIACLDFGES
ncbi:hypothetical protein L2E82_16827 [Cichorium intybus]|uniref:Uncharacterized protein n=1 Tax=Cichorium intybus TaxID=13427 RepID=A0ACB9F782_CICIN|nr:hypothetical protein L2E82_16827 [Cichorium intybus]